MPYYPEEKTAERLSSPERVTRLKRRQKRQKVAAVLVAAVAAALLISVLVRPAGATEKQPPDQHKTQSDDCRGCYDGKTPGNKLTIEPGDCGCLRVRAHNLKAGVAVTVQAGGKSASFTTNRHGNGQVYLTDLPGGSTTVHASGGGASKTKTVRVEACPKDEPPVEQPEPPAQEQPPVDEPKDKPIAGTATSKTRTPKRHRAEPTPDDSPELGTPDQPGTLPFTGPTDLLLPVGLVLIVAGAWLLVYAGRRQREHNLAAAAVARALRKPYRGPRETL